MLSEGASGVPTKGYIMEKKEKKSHMEKIKFTWGMGHGAMGWDESNR